MSLYNEIKNYIPVNEQEQCDKEIMLQFMAANPDYLDRTNLT